MKVDNWFELEYFQAKVEHYAQKLVTDKVVESKMELQELFVQVAKCNSSELASLARDVLEAKETSKTLLGLVNEQASTQKVLESQIKVLELGISQNSKQDQPVGSLINLVEPSGQSRNRERAHRSRGE